MFSKIFSSAALALAASQLVAGQTFTACNPLEKSCPDDPAFGGEYSVDFTKGASDLFEEAAWSGIEYDPSLGAVFSIKKATNAPTMTSTKYIFFGRVDVECRAAPGTGIITSVVLQSDDLDEVDWEWVGTFDNEVQTNYFSKGDTSTYNRGGKSSVSDPFNTFHTYSLDWNKDRINWEINGEVVRTLKYSDGPDTFPQTPMQVKLGTWDAGGPDQPKGTVDWAGGYTDFSNAPFNAYYKNVKIVDHAGGVDGATAYAYSDHSGSYESIEIKTDGSSSSDDDKSTTTAASTTAKETSTKAATTTAAAEETTDAVKTTTAAVQETTDAAVTTKGSTKVSTVVVPTTSAGGNSTKTTGTGGVTGAPSHTIAPEGAAFKSGVNVALMGAAFFASYLLL